MSTCCESNEKCSLCYKLSKQRKLKNQRKLNFVAIFSHNLVTATEKQNSLQKITTAAEVGRFLYFDCKDSYCVQEFKHEPLIFQKCHGHRIVRRLSVPECFTLVTQRMTKYPLLLEAILKVTKCKL